MDPKENIDAGEIYAQKPYYDSGARVETSLRFKPSLRLDCGHRFSTSHTVMGVRVATRAIIVLPEGL